jgi:hypothetical protein
VHVLGHHDERQQREIASRHRISNRSKSDSGKLGIEKKWPSAAGRECELSRLAREVESTEPLSVL